ncbi:amidophosphoribosyltransferase [Tistrella bauzanensis]|nr:amidophosphoribosyltransferase [Tistrella bauzanensis]
MIITHPFQPQPAGRDQFLEDDDHLREECGIFGIHGHQEAARHVALGLHALQHRGQEACGIVTYDGDQFHPHRAVGLVGDAFADERLMVQMIGNMGIGHVRYATTGGAGLRNIQPLYADFAFGGLAIAHNGNLTNALTLRSQLVNRGCIFQSTSDSEVIVHLIAISLYTDVVDKIIDALRQVHGAYSIVALMRDTLIGMRDPWGVRPLVIGKLDGAMMLASETCALDIIGAEFVRDVEPGEIVVIDYDGLRSIKPFPKVSSRFCIFEHIYFARPDSVLENVSVYEARKRIGRELARESLVDADVIVPVPDSGVPAALGFSEESGIPFDYGIIRNHYVGRTFIEPTDQIRHLGVKLKHNANVPMIKGRRVILVDDSIVRGTTSTKIVNMVREAGATEVHMRIASPPTTNPCFYGVDTPSREKLLAARMSIDEMARFMNADSLAFISMDGLYRAMGEPGRNAAQPQYCDACFTGDYALPLTDGQTEGGDAKFRLRSDFA